MEAAPTARVGQDGHRPSRCSRPQPLAPARRARHQFRYLERAGVRRSRAATTVGVDAAAGLVVHVILLVALVPLVGLRTSLKLPSAPDLDAYWPVAVFIVVGLTIAGVWYWRHRLRAIVDRIRPHAQDHALRFWSVRDAASCFSVDPSA